MSKLILSTSQAMTMLEKGYKVRSTDWCEGQYVFFTKGGVMRDEHLQIVQEMWFVRGMTWEIVENDEHKPYMLNPDIKLEDINMGKFSIVCNKCGTETIANNNKDIQIGTWYGGETIITCKCCNEYAILWR